MGVSPVEVEFFCSFFPPFFFCFLKRHEALVEEGHSSPSFLQLFLLFIPFRQRRIQEHASFLARCAVRLPTGAHGGSGGRV